MLCGKFAEIDIRHPERNKVHNVTTRPMHDKLLGCCGKRGHLRFKIVFHGFIDLVAAEAIYHVKCYSQF